MPFATHGRLIAYNIHKGHKTDQMNAFCNVWGRLIAYNIHKRHKTDLQNGGNATCNVWESHHIQST